MTQNISVDSLYGRRVEVETVAPYPVLTMPSLYELMLYTGQSLFFERLQRQYHPSERLLLGLTIQNNEQTEASVSQIAIRLANENVAPVYDLLYELEQYIDHYAFATSRQASIVGGQLIQLFGDLEIIGPIELLPTPRK